jgi:hypothetical protein
MLIIYDSRAKEEPETPSFEEAYGNMPPDEAERLAHVRNIGIAVSIHLFLRVGTRHWRNAKEYVD